MWSFAFPARRREGIDIWRESLMILTPIIPKNIGEFWTYRPRLLIIHHVTFIWEKSYTIKLNCYQENMVSKSLGHSISTGSSNEGFIIVPAWDLGKKRQVSLNHNSSTYWRVHKPKQVFLRTSVPLSVKDG